MKPTISIIIVNYKGRIYIKDCLNSIFKEKNTNYEVIVVDNNSRDGSIELIRNKFSSRKNFHIISLKKNVGAAGGRNTGAAKSMGRYLFFLDYDTIVKPGWSDQIVNFFKKNKKAGCIQAKLLKLGTNRFDYAGDYIGPFGFLIGRAEGAKDIGQFDKIDRIFSMKGAAMILKRTAFDRVGGFDADFEYLWEEPDLTWRLWLYGYEVFFFPFITVSHAYVSSSKNHEYYTTANVTFKGCRNSVMALIKNLETKNLFLILPIHVLCLITICLLFFMTGQIKKSIDVLNAIVWNFKNIRKTQKKRVLIQKKRLVTDEELFDIVGAKKNISYYFKKAEAYITGGTY